MNDLHKSLRAIFGRGVHHYAGAEIKISQTCFSIVTADFTIKQAEGRTAMVGDPKAVERFENGLAYLTAIVATDRAERAENELESYLSWVADYDPQQR